MAEGEKTPARKALDPEVKLPVAMGTLQVVQRAQAPHRIGL